MQKSLRGIFHCEDVAVNVIVLHRRELRFSECSFFEEIEPKRCAKTCGKTTDDNAKQFE